jgi:hypothetical protein
MLFQDSLGKKVCETRISMEKKLSMVGHACYSSDREKHKIGELWSLPTWAKSGTLSPK